MGLHFWHALLQRFPTVRLDIAILTIDNEVDVVRDISSDILRKTHVVSSVDRLSVVQLERPVPKNPDADLVSGYGNVLLEPSDPRRRGSSCWTRQNDTIFLNYVDIGRSIFWNGRGL